jgi:hypothetical protein
MQEDVGQELYTRDHGIVKVEKISFMDGGYHIVLCPNGAYMHSNGLPVKNEKELRAAISAPELRDELEKALNWFKNRHEQLENPPRPIAFHGDGYPIFPDGSVPDFDDLYAFFKPGPILTAAICSLQDYKKRQETGQAPKNLRNVPKGTSPSEVVPPKAEIKVPARTTKKAAKRAKGARTVKGSKSTVIFAPGAG